MIGTIGRLTTQKAPDMFVKMATEVEKDTWNPFYYGR